MQALCEFFFFRSKWMQSNKRREKTWSDTNVDWFVNMFVIIFWENHCNIKLLKENLTLWIGFFCVRANNFLKIITNWWSVESCLANARRSKAQKKKSSRECCIFCLLLWWILSYFIIVNGFNDPKRMWIYVCVRNCLCQRQKGRQCVRLVQFH